MDKKSAIIYGLLGVTGPLSVVPLKAMAVEQQQNFVVHERTAAIVRSLIDSNALYASADATQLLIRKSALSPDLIAGIESSNEATVDPASGDFVVKPEFATALYKAGALGNMQTQTVRDFMMLQGLQRDASSKVPAELAQFSHAPFF